MTDLMIQSRQKFLFNRAKVIEILKGIDIKENWCRGTKKAKYMNLPFAFDIETTSITKYEGTKNEEKTAYMYIWQFCIDGITIIGRLWEEFTELAEIIRDTLKLSEKKRIVCYVHNLAFEFQFMRKYFQWDRVFASDERKPIFAITNGIEFRCSYILSGYSLDTISKNLIDFKIPKLVGDLDYRQKRHFLTELTEKEIDYCINDVLVVCAYIQEKINHGEPISKIPYTATGYVRRYCRDCCLDFRKDSRYGKFIHSLNLDVDLYGMAKRCFQGGFAHGDCLRVGKVIENVSSMDLTSAYPRQMVGTKNFPVTPFIKTAVRNRKHFEYLINNKCCVMTISLYRLNEKCRWEHYISKSKCIKILNGEFDNGRVVRADRVIISITEIDYKIIEEYYDFDKIKILEFYVAERGYLPKPLMLSILKLYKDKTELKGIKGSEIEYMNSKQKINSSYGNMVTDIVRPELTYVNEWVSTIPDMEEALQKYNESKSRYLYYFWGIYVTALNRKVLFEAISELKYDYIYSDTDSVKFTNYEKHKKWFEDFNKRNKKQLIEMCDFYTIDRNLIAPKTIKGVIKVIGDFDYEGTYSHYKTLGAKRYCYDNNGEFTIVVSGLNKEKTLPYLKRLSEETNTSIYNLFSDDLIIPKEYTGKLIHTYIDDYTEEDITDLNGVTAHCKSASAVHLGESEYHLNLAEEYANFLAKQYYDMEDDFNE